MTQAAAVSGVSLPTHTRELEDTVAQALEAARAAGATAAEVALGVDAGLSVSVRLGEVESLEYQRDRGLGVTVYVGQRKGSASTGDLSREAIVETVRKAVSIASFTAEDACAGLPDAADLAREIPDLDLAHPWPISAEEAVELARRCEAAALAVDARLVNSEGGAVGTHAGLRVYGNTHGFLASYPGTQHSVSCSVLGQQGEDMQRDYWYTAARDWRALESAEVVGRIAGERTVRRLGARRLTTCRAPVLFVPELARGLVGHFLSAIRGGAQYRQSSFLLGAAGEQVFPAFVAIHERPHLPRALGSAPFDAEGVATRDQDWVVGGVLRGYILDTYGARRLGLRTTGNAGGTHNLLVEPGTDDFAGLLRRMGRGLVVTELLGQGVNGVTGDYSRGASGFWVEGGELAYPVHEVTIAGNLREMYRGVVAIGADVDRRASLQTGSWLLGEMTIAGE
ncbi:MAG: metalloprotease PmbA [Gammaproteobacteria bacterium]